MSTMLEHLVSSLVFVAQSFLSSVLSSTDFIIPSFIAIVFICPASIYASNLEYIILIVLWLKEQHWTFCVDMLVVPVQHAFKNARHYPYIKAHYLNNHASSNAKLFLYNHASTNARHYPYSHACSNEINHPTDSFIRWFLFDKRKSFSETSEILSLPVCMIFSCLTDVRFLISRWTFSWFQLLQSCDKYRWNVRDTPVHPHF